MMVWNTARIAYFHSQTGLDTNQLAKIINTNIFYQNCGTWNQDMMPHTKNKSHLCFLNCVFFAHAEFRNLSKHQLGAYNRKHMHCNTNGVHCRIIWWWSLKDNRFMLPLTHSYNTKYTHNT